MTSSAKCHQCDRIAYSFCNHYGKVDIHDGFWHCEYHGPVYETDTSNQNVRIDDTSTDSTYQMDGYDRLSRRDRRALLRRLKKGR